ncbi:uncharacterized protein TRAVEDRAFT_121446 [Trametes versicolor FP-101664 SS1]|uniref:uncharacterized protein n=1 Tax=Trametes versicolor (strain FP-101664) TaxID=717944 RepID=UPI000462316B|nr:uncharacterized protein TRAVEDRAFT_121446 [Trametes versicolor FP-101664 SS1]EIW59282.1 hypothetical protein TRAVEDRAFT_121446 [Trametes versicolor FP-101664 SS1]
MAKLGDLPIEVLEQILLVLDPIDVAQFVQTCSAYRFLLYGGPDNQHLWRELYLRQPFDDLRQCYTPLGRPLQEIDWRSQLQRVMRARAVLTKDSTCRPEERCDVLQTLIDMVTHIPPVTHPEGIEPSMNHVWATAMLRGSTLIEHEERELSPEEQQLRARLHTYFGLNAHDFEPKKHTASRAFVYAMRNYRYDNDFGPFMMDGSGRVNWVHLRAVHHVMSMHIVPDMEEAATAVFNIYPMSMPCTQSIIPNGINLDEEQDWAGVEGKWQCSFCFVDHRELLIYNNFNASESEPLQTDIFEDPDFVEVFRSIYVELRILGTEPDPDHPGRPRINFGGSLDGHAIFVGSVKVTPDDQIRWRFTSGEQGNAIWSSEGVQVGNVRSKFGILGSWTTVLHDRHDPVGTSWLSRHTCPCIAS